MGINKDNLLSDEHHASHFSCAICQDLSESPVVLACSHVFCEFCIGEYVARCLDRQQDALCPSCRASSCASAAKLSEANPLAFRCYAKVQTRCPPVWKSTSALGFREPPRYRSDAFTEI